MRYFWNVYRMNLRAAFSMMAQYRFSTLIWAVWGFVGPLISLAVWTAATAAHGGAITHGDVSYGRADFAAYFLTYMIFQHISMSWDAFDFAFRVRDGNLSPRLLKPLHPIHSDAAANITFKLQTSTLLLPVWILLFVLLHPTLPHSLREPLMAIPALVLCAVLRYIWQYSLALIAFWTTRVDAINQLYFTLDSFLAGRIAPLSLLPGALGVIAMYSPFRAMGSFAVELALGRVPANQIATGFALQVGWLAVGIVVFRALWSAGIKQYSAVGA